MWVSLKNDWPENWLLSVCVRHNTMQTKYERRRRWAQKNTKHSCSLSKHIQAHGSIGVGLSVCVWVFFPWHESESDHLGYATFELFFLPIVGQSYKLFFSLQFCVCMTVFLSHSLNENQATRKTNNIQRSKTKSERKKKNLLWYSLPIVERIRTSSFAFRLVYRTVYTLNKNCRFESPSPRLSSSLSSSTIVILTITDHHWCQAFI